jgi:4-methyl-5(b-hydroxyethyl)-thiazole monophosphate biosynthesis
MSKQVLIPIADGSEEIEAVCVIDTLRRAGAVVTVASVGELQVTASRGVRLVADKKLAECADMSYDLIVVPGGAEGSKRLRDSALLAAMLKKQKQENRLCAAICAAPVVVLQTHGMLEGRKATCHPSLAKELKNRQDARVVVDGNYITSQAPGTAIEFALKLVELLFGRSKAEEVAKPMCVPQF